MWTNVDRPLWWRPGEGRPVEVGEAGAGASVPVPTAAVTTWTVPVFPAQNAKDRAHLLNNELLSCSRKTERTKREPERTGARGNSEEGKHTGERDTSVPGKMRQTQIHQEPHQTQRRGIHLLGRQMPGGWDPSRAASESQTKAEEPKTEGWEGEEREGDALPGHPQLLQEGGASRLLGTRPRGSPAPQGCCW